MSLYFLFKLGKKKKWVLVCLVGAFFYKQNANEMATSPKATNYTEPKLRQMPDYDNDLKLFLIEHLTGILLGY